MDSLSNKLHIVIDRTSVDKKRRRRFIDIANKYKKQKEEQTNKPENIKIVCKYFNLPLDKCKEKYIDSQNIPENKLWEVDEMFDRMESEFEEPSLDEGFDQIIEAPKKFKFHAFDFDGTIVENKFPEIDKILDGTVDKMNQLWEDISNVIIVWSCRNGNYENHMRSFLLKNKIPFDFINENPIFETGGRKIFAHEYYDDRNKV